MSLTADGLILSSSTNISENEKKKGNNADGSVSA